MIEENIIINNSTNLLDQKNKEIFENLFEFGSIIHDIHNNNNTSSSEKEKDDNDDNEKKYEKIKEHLLKQQQQNESRFETMMEHVMYFQQKNDELCQKVMEKVKGTILEEILQNMDTMDSIQVRRIHNEKSDVTQRYFENGYQLQFET